MKKSQLAVFVQTILELREKLDLHTVGGTLWHWLLATTTTNADAVDDIALLGLVSKTAGLVGSGWARSAVDDFQLSELY
jgi:hypothetical protein